MIKYTLRVVGIKKEANSTYTYLLEKPQGTSWKEGSHTHIGIEGFDKGEAPDKSLVRHMSIMSLPNENVIGFTTRFVGELTPFKLALKEIKVGDKMVLFKVGSRMVLRRENRPLVFVSMGVGHATMRPLLYAYRQDDTSIPFVTSLNVDNSGEFLFKEELTRLQDDTLSNVWLNNRKELYETVEEVGKDFKDAIYYLVGSDEFLKDMILYLQGKNISLEDIVTDKREEGLKKLLEV